MNSTPSFPLHILSLGAGVQSSTLALMAARGEIGPMPLCAIFADTQAEPASVYRWLDWLETQLPFPVHRVTAGSLTDRITTLRTNKKTGEKYYSNMIPAFVLNKDGSKGIVGRRCTTDYKIVPITQKVRSLVGKMALRDWGKRHSRSLALLKAYKQGSKALRVFPRDAFAACQSSPLAVQWIGISLDEALRMKPSREPWSLHRWPLIEGRKTRHDCLLWLKRNGYPEPPRSACRYCPFHSDAEWRRQRDEEPEEFAQSVATEILIQDCHKAVLGPAKLRGVPFLHETLVPLDKVDFTTDAENGQQSLFLAECEGMCGL